MITDCPLYPRKARKTASALPRNAAERKPATLVETGRKFGSSTLQRSVNLGSIVVSRPSVNVRFGSKADIGLPPVDVRFTPESGHCRTTVGCPRVLPNAPLLFVGDRFDQDARIADSSDSSSAENSTGIISFVVTLPFKSFSTTTSC
jgi:hypothetical protein